jgi:hypothetical protein
MQRNRRSRPRCWHTARVEARRSLTMLLRSKSRGACTHGQRNPHGGGALVSFTDHHRRLLLTGDHLHHGLLRKPRRRAADWGWPRVLCLMSSSQLRDKTSGRN